MSGSIIILNFYIHQRKRQAEDWKKGRKVFARIQYHNITKIVQKSVEMQQLADLVGKQGLGKRKRLETEAVEKQTSHSKTAIRAQVKRDYGESYNNSEREESDDLSGDSDDGLNNSSLWG